MASNIPFHKDRSIKLCIADAWRITALDWKVYLRSLASVLLLTGVADALLIMFLVQYHAGQGLPALLLRQDGVGQEVVGYVATPDVLTVVCLAASALLAAFAHLCLGARLFRLIGGYAASDNFPRNLRIALRRDEWPLVLRLLAVSAAYIVVGAAVSLPLLYLSTVCSPWFVVPVLVIWLYLWSACHVHSVRYALFGHGWWSSARCALRRGFGRCLILQLLVCIPVGWAAGVADLPALVYLLSRTAEVKSVLTGDAPAITAAVSFLFFLLILLGRVLKAALLTLCVLPLALKVDRL